MIPALPPIDATLRFLLQYLALPGIGSLAGGWLGGRRAIEKYRSERALDRRLDWYTRMGALLYRTAGALESANYLEEGGRQEEAARARATLGALVDEVGLAAAESEFYARDTGYVAVRQLVADLNAVGRHQRMLSEEFDPQGARRSGSRLMADKCWATASVLADEARAELGWSVLHREARLPVLHRVPHLPG